MPRFVVTMLVLLLVCPLRAEVRLPALFGDGMVLQQGQPIRIWGWADAGEAVSVTFAGASAKTIAGVDGCWRVELPATQAKAPHTPQQLVVRGSNVVTIDNVLIGEVWLCSGQSNMLFRVASVRDAEKEIASATHPQIRLLQVQKGMAYQPQSTIQAKWAVCSPTSVTEFSAVGYFFGRQLQQELDVPVGLINASWGGTRIHSWTPIEAVRESHPYLIEQGDQWLASFPERIESSKQRMAEWDRSVAQARVAGLPEPDPSKKPKKILRSDNKPHYPGVLYNGMVAPLAPLSVRGVVWYQGESNTPHPEDYESQLNSLIDAWRSAFQNPGMHFGVVQLANFQEVKAEADEKDGWERVREAQQRVAAGKPGVGLAVTIDIGEAGNVHPTNKQDVGRRLAAWASHSVYGRKDVVPSGPVFKGMTSRDGKLVLSFDYAEGLTVKGDKLGGFVIAGSDGKFVFADAVVEGSTVIVSSPTVTDPKAVRYGWANNPVANLYNAAGLPAGPFRTDRTDPSKGNHKATLPADDDAQAPGE